jgi:hypothetical protein
MNNRAAGAATRAFKNNLPREHFFLDKDKRIPVIEQPYNSFFMTTM